MTTPSNDTPVVDDDKTNGEKPMIDGDVATAGNKSKQADDVSIDGKSEPSVEKPEKKQKVTEGEDNEDSKKTSDNLQTAIVKEKDTDSHNDSDTHDTDINVDSDSQDKDSNKSNLESEDEGSYDAYYANTEEYLDSGSDKELNALSSDMGIFPSKDDSESTKKYQESSSDEYDEKWSRPWRSKKQRTKKEKEKKSKPFSFTKRWSERDTEAYRSGYPGKKDNMNQKANLEFYLNKRQSRPDGDLIDRIHSDWFGDYHRLEAHHGYIQWLFPIRENGMNFHAQELQLHEAQAIRDDRKAKRRVLKSYELMLDFYGIKLKNRETGELERAENWKERYAHLNRSMHNYLRITRILKSLGELGYEHLKAPFVKFILVEALQKKTLDKTVQSCYNYWLETVRDDEEREKLQAFADQLLTS